MLAQEDRLQLGSELARASEADLFAALGAATMALGTADEVLALGALNRTGGAESLRTADMKMAADLAESVALEDRGRNEFELFLSEFGERLKANVCAVYAKYRSGETDEMNLVGVVRTAVVAAVASTVWGPVVGILVALLLKTGLDMLCDLESTTVTP